MHDTIVTKMCTAGLFITTYQLNNNSNWYFGRTYHGKSFVRLDVSITLAFVMTVYSFGRIRVGKSNTFTTSFGNHFY